MSVQIAQRWVLARAAPSHLLHARRSQCRHWRAGRRDQRAADEEPRASAGARSSSSSIGPALKPLPRDALRAGGMEAVSRQHRLSRRGRPQLLQRAVSARARARRGALHGERPSKSSSRAAASPSHVRLTGRGRFATQARAHAARASRARGMDAVAARSRGRNRPARPPAGSSPASSSAARIPSKATARASGLMRLGRSTAPIGSKPRVHRAERLRSYRFRTVEHILINQQDRLPLEDPAPARPALTHENLRGATYYEEAYADAPHDREAPRPAPDGDGRRRLTSNAARASMPSCSFDDRFGLLVDTEWTAREHRRLTQRLRHAKLRYPASLEDVDFTHAARPEPRGGPEPRHGRLDSRASQSADHRADRDRQIVVGVGLRPERVSPRLHGDLRPGAAAAARARRQSRRRLVCRLLPNSPSSISWRSTIGCSRRSPMPNGGICWR